MLQAIYQAVTLQPGEREKQNVLRTWKWESRTLESFTQPLNFPVMPPCLSVTQISRFFGNHMKNGTAAAIGARLHILFLRQAIQAAKSWGQGKRVAVPRKCLFWWIRKTLCNGCAAALGEGTCREQGGAGQGEDARSSAGTRRKGDPARSLK